MKITAFMLNIVWTITAIFLAIISLPRKASYNKKPSAIIFKVRSLWWYSWLPKTKGMRGMALGNIVLLGPKELSRDLEHELIHIEQMIREPFIHPFLYYIEIYKHGYRENKYEKEAYEKSGSVYIENI